MVPGSGRRWFGCSPGPRGWSLRQPVHLDGPLLLAAPAHAASVVPASSGRSDACTSWGCGSGTWTWGKSALPAVSMSVNDTDCNGLGAGIQLNVTFTTGARWAGPIHWSGYDCHQGYYLWNNLSYSGSTPIQSARLVIWQKDTDGSPTGYAATTSTARTPDPSRPPPRRPPDLPGPGGLRGRAECSVRATQRGTRPRTGATRWRCVPGCITSVQVGPALLRGSRAPCGQLTGDRVGQPAGRGRVAVEQTVHFDGRPAEEVGGLDGLAVGDGGVETGGMGDGSTSPIVWDIPMANGTVPTSFPVWAAEWQESSRTSSALSSTVAMARAKALALAMALSWKPSSPFSKAIRSGVLCRGDGEFHQRCGEPCGEPRGYAEASCATSEVHPMLLRAGVRRLLGGDEWGCHGIGRSRSWWSRSC